MRSIQTEENAVTIWVTGEPAPEGGEVLRLVRRALAEGGFSPWPDTTAECFASGEDVLVLARPGEPRRGAYLFPDREALSACARAVPWEGGAVYAVPEGYILTLEAREAPPGIAEFGDELQLHPLWEAYAREREWCVLPDCAGERLRQ